MIQQCPKYADNASALFYDYSEIEQGVFVEVFFAIFDFAKKIARKLPTSKMLEFVRLCKQSNFLGVDNFRKNNFAAYTPCVIPLLHTPLA